MEFNEDPFKDADHRYGDPFDLEGADPFKNEQQDPFTASVDDAFGTLPKKHKEEEKTFDPFNMSTDVQSNNLDDSFDPFSAKNLAKLNTTTKDDFKDPFGASSSSSDAPWTAFSSDDPFSAVPVTRSKTSVDPFAAFQKDQKVTLPSKSPNRGLQKSETTANVSQSLSRPWGSPNDPFSSGGTSSIPRSRPSRSDVKKDPFMPALDLSNTADKKEKKNNFKIGHFKPSFIKKDKEKKDKNSTKVIKNDLGAPSAPPPMEEAHLRYASEASKRAEDERQERLRIQEEQDLAYAIALSKAEAASLSNQ